MKRFFLRLIGFRDYVIIGETKSGYQFHCIVFTNEISKAVIYAKKYLIKNGEEFNNLTSVKRF